MLRFYPFLLPILLFCSCNEKRLPSGTFRHSLAGNTIPVTKNPLDTILGDKVSDDGKTIVRYNNFESLKKLKASVLKDSSELYEVVQIDSVHYRINQRKSYTTARAFGLIVRIAKDKIKDYYVLNDYEIVDCQPTENGWILLCSDWQNGNIFWKKDYNILIRKLSADLKEKWSYVPNNSDFPIDCGNIDVRSGKMSFSVNVITSCHICYSIVDLTLDEQGKYVSAVQTGHLNVPYILTGEELGATFDVKPKKE